MQKVSGNEPVFLETVVVKGTRSSSFSQKINVDASGIIDLNDLEVLLFKSPVAQLSLLFVPQKISQTSRWLG